MIKLIKYVQIYLEITYTYTHEHTHRFLLGIFLV